MPACCRYPSSAPAAEIGIRPANAKAPAALETFIVNFLPQEFIHLHTLGITHPQLSFNPSISPTTSNIPMDAPQIHSGTRIFPYRAGQLDPAIATAEEPTN